MWLVRIFRRISQLFSRKKFVKLGLYGPPNGGKTTLANRICADWLGEEMGSTSRIAHETRRLYRKEKVTIADDEGRTLTFTLVDTPGIASRIDYEDFVKEGLTEKESKQRAREAKDGVLQSVKFLDQADCVVVVLDSTKEPTSQVNETLIRSLEERKIPLFIVANKIDLEEASIDRVHSAYPQHEILGISAKYGDNMTLFYEKLFSLVNQVR